MAWSASAPLAAIVTPVYNGARFLAETMECVQAQTYPNLVHVVLDNASTDDTPAIIQRFSGGRVPILTARNDETVPFGENWERAIQLAPADAVYLRVLCADDKITPVAMERTMAVAVSHPDAGVVGCGFKVMDEVQEGHWGKGVTALPGREAARRSFMGEGEFIGPHILMRADLVRARRPFYDLAYNGIDTEGCLYLLQRSDWANTDEILAWTRVHDESLSHKNMHAQGLHFSDWYRLIHTYGAWAMEPRDLNAHKKAYMRYYLRRLMVWSARRKSASILSRHVALMRQLDKAPTLLEYVDAIADVGFRRLKLRTQVRAGFPLG
jgi:glycosyltransferase involved in cell wall biosynthesis